MQRTEFVAVGAEHLKKRIASAQREGWAARITRNPQLEAAGITGMMVKLEHPDAPYPVILCRGRPGLRLTAIRRDSSRGFVWVELVADPDTTFEAVDDAPVVAALISGLDALLDS